MAILLFLKWVKTWVEKTPAIFVAFPKVPKAVGSGGDVADAQISYRVLYCSWLFMYTPSTLYRSKRWVHVNLSQETNLGGRKPCCIVIVPLHSDDLGFLTESGSLLPPSSFFFREKSFSRMLLRLPCSLFHPPVHQLCPTNLKPCFCSRWVGPMDQLILVCRNVMNSIPLK